MAGKPNKLAFLSMSAPASYVAGLGRGASGFTTRSDIGPAREGPSAEVIAEAQARRGEEAEVDPDQFQDPDNEYGLFAGTTYEADDEEADRIYEKVDEAMDARRKARREAQEQLEMAKHRAERPKIQAQFADLKRGLTAVTDAEWEGIPEVGNLTRKKRKTEGRTYVVPDSILVGDRERGGIGNVVQDGQETPANTGTLTNFVEIGQARDKILSLKLDQISGTATSLGASGTSTSIDPKGYLTSLDSVQIKSSAEIGDIKRARMLFDSLVKSNPKHAPGWIAAACLEEHAGRMVAARKLIREGCERCPVSEDVWLEAARLHSNDDAKVILANAVQHVGQSVKIWLAAADLEGDVKAKKRVLRKALEHIPNSVRLWKETVNLETSATDALIPLSVELWLALARIETPDKAKAVLNKARKAVPTSHEIWIAAGRLLEQEAGKNEDPEKKKKEMDTVDKTIEAGVRELRRHQVLLTREQWLKEAERCESEGSVRTCEAIVKATVGMELEDEDRLDTWMGDAESAEGRGMVATARAILAYALKVYPDRRALWQQGLDELLGRAVECCPQAEVLWLMAAKEKWLAGDVPGARGVLERAFIANQESEQIWLAARGQLLVRARDVADTQRIWMKSAVFERQQGQIDEALKTLSTALKKFPKFAKLYMVQGQIYEDRNDIPSARASYAAGLKSCPKEPTLWMLASRLEEKDGKSIKARALLEKARQVNPGNELLWLESIGVEERSGGGAGQVLARALQDCPTSGVLWSKSIWSEPRPMRKARSADALKKTGGGEGGGSAVICTIARLFWAERKVEKARQWFGRAVGVDGDLGDLWGWWLKFERQHGVEEQREEVRVRCVQAEPHHGLVWPAVAKDLKNVGKGAREILEMVADKLEE
ncbi:PRP1 splicing factor, N-terminal-domain-containing protein [Desarmillaria tabescens]|uniref:PRP1 splicing factor, N-terminal-domain-containing protein n=1 Tax=Armillaria tabescens TaxID=1929756 RepID=A0AA39MM98_ARMTA|nr:PRP1 splicing factor, N-terminal-domain-containing protein [Desarmillaria tabescens]KAK0440011.1 PRP1 splicing factor, N-terminal-domain-containing protein [Desarmillaria tabescens]